MVFGDGNRWMEGLTKMGLDLWGLELNAPISNWTDCGGGEDLQATGPKTYRWADISCQNKSLQNRGTIIKPQLIDARSGPYRDIGIGEPLVYNISVACLAPSGSESAD